MAAADEKAKIRAPHLFGQRMAAVRDALQPGQPLAAKACTALKVLDKLRPHLERRNILIHATGSVWINASGAWRWQLHAIGPEPDSG